MDNFWCNYQHNYFCTADNRINNKWLHKRRCTTANHIYFLYLSYYIISIIFSSVKTIINDFFIAKDIQQLMTLPISIAHIFLVKMIKMWLLSVLWIYLIVAITMAVNLYHQLENIHVIFTTLITMLGLCLVYTALTFAFIYMLTKVLPKNKINEIMTALIGVFGAVSYFIYIGPLNFIGKTLTPLPDFYYLIN